MDTPTTRPKTPERQEGPGSFLAEIAGTFAGTFFAHLLGWSVIVAVAVGMIAWHFGVPLDQAFVLFAIGAAGVACANGFARMTGGSEMVCEGAMVLLFCAGAAVVAALGVAVIFLLPLIAVAALVGWIGSFFAE